ncbi:two-component system LytT family response regulator [Aquimarina sp. EL_43]|uniref:LytR/AlgR family response regulator transcription factor n=1 Tax=Aquimarina TaxID=290174 RepID=UPI00047134DB|nr:MULTISPECIES: LytTR family DNA-binding domain-containing protein [Aquimarina]MBG6130354.1 two-component system LytT family response regulator [Aquimarina sp. EL_35]MBG6149134.1 two-component system LytT family response regulator [Aquimarina sp. EL_32]MBG6168492.1 two-component system LytT family response regulator [Aquimarina sp. EL_43]
MKTVIVEDKEYIRKGLLNLLQLIDAEIEVIGECESVKDAVVVANACKPELIFLDINLTDGTGFDFLKQTENLNFKVIFITAYEEHALQALKIGAVDYLLKPVDVDELQIALQKVIALPITEQKKQIKTVKEVWNNEDSTLILSLHDSFQVVNLNELLFCESDKGYTTFHCSDNKKYMVSKTLKEFEERLSKANFTRPHQSFMVNLKFIDKYDKSGVIYLKNGKKIPVSSRRKEHFLNAFLHWNKN